MNIPSVTLMRGCTGKYSSFAPSATFSPTKVFPGKVKPRNIAGARSGFIFVGKVFPRLLKTRSLKIPFINESTERRILLLETTFFRYQALNKLNEIGKEAKFI